MIPQTNISRLTARLTDEETVTSIGTVAAGNMNAVLQRRWGRVFVPSLSDLLFVALIAWLFMSAGAHGWQSLLADADVGWHIRTGEYILNHHAVPHQDLYSFSKPGAPWYAWEWLTDVIDAALFRLAGLKGVVLMAGVVIALFATTLMRRVVDAGAHLFVALLVVLLGVGSASIHFLARPHVFTLLLLSIAMGIIEADRRSEKRPIHGDWKSSRRIWWLVPITLVWTNLHGGFLILIALLGLAASGAAAEEWIAKAPGERANWGPALHWAKLTAACAAVSLINPYGWELHLHVVEYLRSDWIRTVVQEFQSPSFRSENMLQFEVLLFAGLIAAGARFRRGQVIDGLWVLALAYLALSSVRHVPVFVAVLAPLIASEATSWWRAFVDGAPKNSAQGILNQMGMDLIPGFQRTSIWSGVAVVALMATGSPIPWPADFPSEVFPTALVHAHEQQILHSRVLTTDQWADYLIFLHPEQKVFVDGRSDFYGPEIGNRFLHLMAGAPGWQQVIEQYKFNLALIPSDVALAQLLRTRPEWSVEAEDGKRILLVLKPSSVLTAKSTGENQGSRD
jgi:hypothetical protein